MTTQLADIKRPALRLLAMALLMAVACLPARAQIAETPDAPVLNSDSIRQAFDNQPYFGLYKDNYFIFGTAIGPKPDKVNSNIKFQISIAQRLTKSTLPWGTYLYLFYSQKVIWNILMNSQPMTDLNFNPGVGLAKPFFSDNRYIGKAFVVFEHESNGRDGDISRSWERLSFGANILIDQNLMVHGKFWIPWADGMHNRDITKYCGIFQTGMQAMSNDRKYNCAITLVKRAGINFNYNTILEFGVRLWAKHNQYLFFQYYNGYGENLLDYKQYRSEFRVGIQIKPPLFSDF